MIRTWLITKILESCLERVFVNIRNGFVQPKFELTPGCKYTKVVCDYDGNILEYYDVRVSVNDGWNIIMYCRTVYRDKALIFDSPKLVPCHITPLHVTELVK